MSNYICTCNARLVQLLRLFLIQLFPNWTPIHVITHPKRIFSVCVLMVWRILPAGGGGTER